MVKRRRRRYDKGVGRKCATCGRAEGEILLAEGCRGLIIRGPERSLVE